MFAWQGSSLRLDLCVKQTADYKEGGKRIEMVEEWGENPVAG